ncbi:DUF4435 domain-containing protein [Wohlfahrtiimonas chitiniclastica]|uniref:DUF4435 domain-containing protein n=1 Tax=Wohlfahrtiimonas chitiniclastica TaxID=400946 RepID=UPI001BD0A0A4|nr:DUF4435 domain-containing protein [Wohlfahrtiimonas chitiniclastica]MBS7815951.1 DUF4435 domain-containing protein [Wohlfahrtiimonas chitiniclastica]MBS7822054.1 DUF4435 domain-containing protein [Wohlfahrtiimonas chitiniclastica]MBS7829846.1 DUF4435 domain-containing protein [Wohlfahrtiimonas chitiniclastica]MBS7831813.1 DUF4435 domain-containing protein [Wohlfahrtiimonas chitiniclastica]
MISRTFSAENSFTWSDEALDIKPQFYNVDIILYVEGVDDIRFWEIIFEKFASFNVHVEDLGGCEEVKEMARKILSGDIRKAIASLDRDLGEFDNQLIQHPNILYTYGYAIENTLITSNILTKVIRSLGKYKDREINKSEIEDWLQKLYLNMKDLIILDIHAFIEQIGVKVIGDSGDRFLDPLSVEICQTKKNNFLLSLKDKFLNDELFKELQNKYHQDYLFHWLKGHFLFTAAQSFVSYYIKKSGKKISLSRESFYSNVILAFEIDFNDQHKEYGYYQDQINSIDTSLFI